MSHLFGNPPLILSGTIAVDANERVIEDFNAILTGAILAHTSSDGNPSWEKYVVSDAPFLAGYNAYDRDVYFRSVGSHITGSGGLLGDNNIWLRYTSAFNYNVSNKIVLTTLNPALEYDFENDIVSTFGLPPNSSTIYATLYNNKTLEYWIWINEYEITVLLRQDTAFETIGGGSLYNPAGPRNSGVARIADNSVVSGSYNSLVVNLDRDIKYENLGPSALQPNQGVWFVRQRQIGEQLSASNTMINDSIVRVTNISADGHQITISGTLNQDYPSGSLVGVDPQGLYASTISSNSYNFYTLSNYNAAKILNNSYLGYFSVPPSQFSEFMSPSPINFYSLIKTLVCENANSTRRGTHRFIHQIYPGNLVDKDIVILQGLTGSIGREKSYRIFPTVNMSPSNNADYKLALGSGALG